MFVCRYPLNSGRKCQKDIHFRMRSCLPTTILAGGSRGISLFTSCSIVQAAPHLMNPKCWGCKHVLPYLTTLAPFQARCTANMMVFYVSLSCLTPMRQAGGNAVPPLGPLPQAVINLWVVPSSILFSFLLSHHPNASLHRLPVGTQGFHCPSTGY